MPDYSKGKIYAIIPYGVKLEDAEGDVYIGSTAFVNLQAYFKNKHVNAYVYKKSDMRKSSFLLFEKFGIEGCEIILLENYACKNRNELERKEGEYQRKIKCVNKRIAGRSRHEYQIENADALKARDKIRNAKRVDYNRKKSAEYYKINKEAISDKRTERIMCECGIEYTHHHAARHRKSKKHATLMEALSLQEHQAHAPTSE